MSTKKQPLFGTLSELHRIRVKTGKLVPIVAPKAEDDQVPIPGDIFSLFVTEGKPPVYIPDEPVIALGYVEPGYEDGWHLHEHSYELYIVMGPWDAAYRANSELRVVSIGEPGFILFPPRVPHRIKVYAPAFSILASTEPGKPAAGDRVEVHD